MKVIALSNTQLAGQIIEGPLVKCCLNTRHSIIVKGLHTVICFIFAYKNFRQADINLFTQLWFIHNGSCKNEIFANLEIEIFADEN